MPDSSKTLIIHSENGNDEYTVRDLAEEFKLYVRPRHSQGTQQQTENILRMFLPTYGDRPLSSMVPLDISEYATKRLETDLRVVSVNRELRRLKMMMFNYDYDAGKINRNPVPRRLLPEPKLLKMKMTPQEFMLLYRKLSMPWQRDFIALAVLTGIRRKELCGLLWENVDLSRKELRVIAITAKGQHERVVPLSEDAVSLLKRRKKNSRSSWVFTLEKKGHEGRPVALNKHDHRSRAESEERIAHASWHQVAFDKT